jgi:hypothetical protein
MPEVKAQSSGAFPENKTVASEISDPQNQDQAKIEDSPNTPKPGRMPARASRIEPSSLPGGTHN